MTDVSTILDHIKPFVVAGDVFREPTNEFWGLVCLYQGMEHLNDCVKRCEEQVVSNLGDDANSILIYPAKGDAFEGVSIPLVEMAFHWYSISATQYVKTVASITLPNCLTKKESGKRVTDYVESVIDEVANFRDKVAAHYAGLTKNNRDSAAERGVSLHPQLGFRRGKFMVSLMSMSITSSGKTSDSKKLQPWSVTEIHEALRHRYWRHGAREVT